MTPDDVSTPPPYIPIIPDIIPSIPYIPFTEAEDELEDLIAERSTAEPDAAQVQVLLDSLC